MSFIENVSRFDISTGFHYDVGENSVLIQISDINQEHPKPLYAFKEVKQFKFEDVEEETPEVISEEQAKEIAEILLNAKENDMNVIVHCVAGLCRSGAVVECGVLLGFDDPGKLRLPNTLVKKKIMKHLGYEMSESTSAFAEDFYNRCFD